MANWMSVPVTSAVNRGVRFARQFDEEVARLAAFLKTHTR